MGKVLKIVGMIALVLVVLVIVVGIYFYNFYVFKTVRICIGNGVDSETLCDSVQDCVDLISEHGLDVNLSIAPNFISENFQKIIDEVIYCDGTCFIKDVRGVNPETQELEMLESCEEGETEFVIKIRGKDGLAIWKYLKNRE